MGNSQNGKMNSESMKNFQIQKYLNQVLSQP